MQAMQAIGAELDGLIAMFEKDPGQEHGVVALNASLNKVKTCEKRINGEIQKRQRLVPETPRAPPLIKWDSNATKMLEQEIAIYLLRDHKPAAVEALVRESPHLDSAPIATFEQYFAISNSIEALDLEPALAWANTVRCKPLIEELQSLQFALLVANDKLAAVEYMRNNLKFDAQRAPALLRVLASPPVLVPALVDPSVVQQARDTFEREYMRRTGHSPDAALEVATAVGSRALRGLQKSHQVMKNRHADWTSSEELPVAIDTGRVYHPVFVCPVSKLQTTEANPPMLLPCRHILAAETVKILLENSLTRNAFKCPYCPETASVNSLMKVRIE